jgi:small subunit ribosomal protein S19e
VERLTAIRIGIKMVSARDVDQSELVKKIAVELEQKITMPEWAKYVKTGVSRERVPEQRNWWYLRAASILRKIYMDGPVGTSRLRSYYGGLHRRGHKPAHFAKASGKIIRTILQQLEVIGFVKKELRKGRSVTPAGQKFVDNIAKTIAKQ